MKSIGKVRNFKIIIPAVILLVFAAALIIYCVQTGGTNQSEESNQPEIRIHAEDVEAITIIDRKWHGAKLIEKSEDIEEVCDILNSIEILDCYPYEETMYGGNWLTYVITFTSGEEESFYYYAGTSLEYDRESYYIEDGRLELMWTSAHYNFKEGTYDPIMKTVTFDK